jgi:hypothetical protein
MGDSEAFRSAPIAAYLFQATGNVAQSRQIEAAYARGVRDYWTPVNGPEVALALIGRAQMAAVVGDRVALVENLARYHERGAILPAFIPREPWFETYQDDPAVADLFAKAATRREDARKKLRAEGF